MRFVSCSVDDRIHWGVAADRDVCLPDDERFPATLQEVVDLGLGRALDLGRRLLADPQTRRRPLDAVRLLAPLPQPRRNIMCLGLNYAAHAKESQQAKGKELALPEYPIVFTKSAGSVTGPHDDIHLDADVTRQLDWEAELAVVIGQAGRRIPQARAMEHVFGYTVINDLSARDLQFRHKQFFLGKSLDGGCPMGPWIITADEIPDPHDLALSCTVNGVVKQQGHTSDQIFRIPRVIEDISLPQTLEPGDIIATGTPEGVGFARRPPEFLGPGDVVECTVERVGTLRNRIVHG